MTKKVLAAYDGSILSNEAIQEAKKQASLFPETEVHIFTVIESTGPTTNAAISRNITKEVSEKMLPQMEKIKQEFMEASIPVVTEVRFADIGDNPGKIICEYADNKGIDLIIAGSRGLGNIKSILLGSVSNHIVQNAKCRVLIVK
ncbi:universal stress protein [Virgibacillus alimentarius]|uniref:Nucleotide-binding universal stress UspA family protein n=1 Tax=Virgibacillus alimentarius TaxID=698769 RepID=A0ABS4SC07_9BACI|nr:MULTISPECIES: universal stress protein [Virgibacillus]MBP2257932.1 nucleotide-binding universal stress UspA family protein [Virgibacillus alimentarius]HLR65974.1 universal stress protein [Virgibacillus sp.]